MTMDLGRLVCKRCGRILARLASDPTGSAAGELARCPCVPAVASARDDLP